MGQPAQIRLLTSSPGPAAGGEHGGHQRRLHAAGGGRLAGAGAQGARGGPQGSVHGSEPQGGMGEAAAGPAGAELCRGGGGPGGVPQRRGEAGRTPGALPALH